MTIWPVFALLLLTGYLLGAIPFCFVIGRLYGVDIRKVGSGNVGATNLRRGLAGKPFGGVLAAVGLILDAMKGFAVAFWLPALFVQLFHPVQPYPLSAEWLPISAGTAAVVGHTYTIFLKFHGGKGVATGAGMFLAVCWQGALAGVMTFAIVYAVSRIASLSSLMGAAVIPIASVVYYHYTTGVGAHLPVVILMLAVVVLVFFRHRANIGRLIRGEELSFRAAEKSKEAALLAEQAAASTGVDEAAGAARQSTR